MLSSLKQLYMTVCISLAALLCPLPAKADDYNAAFRFLSLAIRDVLPTVAEAKEFHAATDKDAKLDYFTGQWLQSNEHKARVKRHFNDMFGISPWVFIADANLDLMLYDPASPGSAPSDLNTAGVYHLANTVKATCGTPVSATAWWSDSNIMICPSAVSAAISFSNGSIRCTDPFAANGILHANCGCGPDQIICYPKHLKKNIVSGVALEFAERGYYAYTQGLGWLDLLGGNKFYGNRWLYHHYLWQEKIGYNLELPSQAELTFLKSLPTTGQTYLPLPATTIERSGVVTSPAFLRRFNNFRSRVRAITEQLLCKDIDGSLNVDNYDQFINPSLSAFDRAHGEQQSCATCHYSLDNFGSTILGWTPEGYFEKWAPPSQLGHVFGEDGTGPRFLMASYIERGTDFNLCMAKKTWQEFSGADWNVLSATEKQDFLTSAAAGPKEAIEAVLSSDALKNLRLFKSSTVTSTNTVTYNFNADINPILENSCGGSECHSQGNSRGTSSAYIDGESAFKAAPGIRISNGSMPPANSGKYLSEEEKNKLLIFLGQ